MYLRNFFFFFLFKPKAPTLFFTLFFLSVVPSDYISLYHVCLYFLSFCLFLFRLSFVFFLISFFPLSLILSFFLSFHIRIVAVDHCVCIWYSSDSFTNDCYFSRRLPLYRSTYLLTYTCPLSSLPTCSAYLSTCLPNSQSITYLSARLLIYPHVDFQIYLSVLLNLSYYLYTC